MTRISTFELDGNLFAFPAEGALKTADDEYRLTYWVRRPGDDPAAFSYWEYEGDFRPDRRESNIFRTKLVRATSRQLSVGTYDVSAIFSADGSSLFEIVSLFIKQGRVPSAVESIATDPFAALEFAHLKKLSVANSS